MSHSVLRSDTYVQEDNQRTFDVPPRPCKIVAQVSWGKQITCALRGL